MEWSSVGFAALVAVMAAMELWFELEILNRCIRALASVFHRWYR